MRPWAVVLLEKPEAMSRMLLSAKPTKFSNAPITPSPLMLLQLPYVPDQIHVKDWSTGLLAGGGGTTTEGTFDNMIE